MLTIWIERTHEWIPVSCDFDRPSPTSTSWKSSRVTRIIAFHEVSDQGLARGPLDRSSRQARSSGAFRTGIVLHPLGHPRGVSRVESLFQAPRMRPR
eukprot:9001947-Pyramimonas_sp.AAC.1